MTQQRRTQRRSRRQNKSRQQRKTRQQRKSRQQRKLQNQNNNNQNQNGGGKKKRKMNAFFQKMMTAKRQNKAQFEHNNKVYKRQQKGHLTFYKA